MALNEKSASRQGESHAWPDALLSVACIGITLSFIFDTVATGYTVL